MSSIESTSASTLELWLMQQRLARQARAQSGTSGVSTAPPAETQAQFQAAALAAGLDPTAVDGLQEEIRSAITLAVENAGVSTDRRQIIQTAIDGVLQNHGVDLEKLKAQLRPAGGAGGAGGPPPGPPPDDNERRTEREAQFTSAAIAAGLDPRAADPLQSEIESAVHNVLENSDSTTDPRPAIQDVIDTLLKNHGVDLAKFRSQLQSAMDGTAGADFPLVDEQA